MKLGKQLGIAGMLASVAVCLGGVAPAVAAFPNFTDCPPMSTGSACIDVQSQSGEIEIKGFRVPLDHSLEIRGGMEQGVFVPPVGTNGFFAEPVNVPGGLLGLELPLSLNLVTATAELAGPASSIHIRVESELTLEMPLKLRLSNPLIGSNCHIGTDRNPVLVHLTTGTTNPPPPNTPISGRRGTLTFFPPDAIGIVGSVDVDNELAIPGASGCGGLGLIDLLIDGKLKLPSAAGNNTLIIQNDAALREVA